MKTQNETQVKNDSYIGVDVAKATLDAYRTHDKGTRQFPNSKDGFKQFLKWIKDEPPMLVNVDRGVAGIGQRRSGKVVQFSGSRAA